MFFFRILSTLVFVYFCGVNRTIQVQEDNVVQLDASKIIKMCYDLFKKFDERRQITELHSTINIGHLESIMLNHQLSDDDNLNKMLVGYRNIRERYQDIQNGSPELSSYNNRERVIQPVILRKLDNDHQNWNEITIEEMQRLLNVTENFTQRLSHDYNLVLESGFLDKKWNSFVATEEQTRLLFYMNAIYPRKILTETQKSMIRLASESCFRLKHLIKDIDMTGDQFRPGLFCGALGYVEVCTKKIRDQLFTSDMENSDDSLRLSIGIICLHREVSLGFDNKFC